MDVLKDSYSEIFSQRGKLYHMAMEKYPNARKEEFQHSLENVIFNDGDIICDIPSGGGYLAPYINKNCNLISIEFSNGFTDQNTNINNCALTSPSKLPLKNNSINTTISIAGIHHHSNQQSFYSEIFRSLKSNGLFVLSDVQINSNIAFFLDNIVGKYNSTGHSGIYLSSKTKNELEKVGFHVTNMKLNKFSWIFDSLHDITDFMKIFFDLNNISHAKLLNYVQTILGIEKRNGKYHVGWSLMTFYCKS